MPAPSGFHLGLSSRLPIDSFECLNEGFQHGALIAKLEGLILVVTHLTPFHGSQRLEEAKKIMGVINKKNTAGDSVIVMVSLITIPP
jgi:hypothetical protein